MISLNIPLALSLYLEHFNICSLVNVCREVNKGVICLEGKGFLRGYFSPPKKTCSLTLILSKKNLKISRIHFNILKQFFLYGLDAIYMCQRVCFTFSILFADIFHYDASFSELVS